VVPISANNRKKRLVFCEKQEEEDDFWDHAVWSDELTVEACPHNGNVKVFVHCNQKVLGNTILPASSTGRVQSHFLGRFHKTRCWAFNSCRRNDRQRQVYRFVRQLLAV
jgi:hypothetical protein